MKGNRFRSMLFGASKLQLRHFWSKTFVVTLIVISGLQIGTTRAQINLFQGWPRLTDDDYKLLDVALHDILYGDYAIGKTEAWQNPATGNHGEVTFKKSFSSGSMPCKMVKFSVVDAKTGGTWIIVFNGCKFSSGEWKVVS